MIDFQPDENKLDFQLDFQEEEKKPKTTVAEDIYSSVAQAANTIDTGASMIVGGLSRPFNKEFSDVVYNNMERRVAGRNKATDVSNKEQGIPGKVIGTVGTLPLQMAAMPFGPFESSKVALDQGESLGKAAGIFGIDALGTGLGLALPGVVPGKLLTKAASGAAINAAQDVATRKAIELVADKETTKQILGPSLESAVVSGIVGGGIGALSKQPKKKQTTPTPKVDVDAIITEHKHGAAAPTEGLVKQDPIARMASDLGATQPDNPVMRSMVDQLNPDTQAAKMLSDEETARQLNAQRDIDARQAALEQEVRQRATLDLNAAERARQEVAPTGFAEWQEGLRTAAEQRLPGDNTPMPFEQIKAPYGLSDAPYQHGAGLDPTQFLAERQSLPVEVSHQLGKPYELPKVTDEVNSILRDGTVDERAGKMALPVTVLDTLQSQRRGGKQSGAIDVQSVVDGLKKLKQGAISALDYIKLFKGAFTDGALGTALDDVNDPKSRKTLTLLSPDEFHKLAIQRYNGDSSVQQERAALHNSIRQGLSSEDGLRQLPWLHVREDKAGKSVVTGHEGRHRMDVFKEMGIDLIPVVVEHSTKRWGEFTPNKTIRPEAQPFDPVTGRPLFDWDGEHFTGETQRPIRKFPKSLHTQQGAIDIEAISEGVKNLFRKAEIGPVAAVARQVTDNTSTPVSAGKVQERINLAKKEAATGLSNQYQRVTTLEQAKAMIDPKTDMSAVGGNGLRSGSEAVLRTNIKNAIVNFVNTSRQTARNTAEVLSKRYVTGKDAIVATKKRLSDEELIRVAEVIHSLSKHQTALDDALIQKLQLNSKEAAAVRALREGFDARYQTAMDAALSAGFEGFKFREGYFPSVFQGARRALVGKTKDGKFSTKGMVAVDSILEYKAAIKKYKEMGYDTVIPLEFNGAPDSKTRTNVFDGFAQLVAQIAKFDPDFAEAQMAATQAGKDQVRALYRFDVHELQKKGISGHLGNKPWKSALDNAKEMYEGAVSYLEDGFRYDAMQKPLMDFRELQVDSAFREKMPNTAKWLDKIVGYDSGGSLNTVGAFINGTENFIMQSMGLSPAHARSVIGKLTGISTTKMMGMFNAGFAALQLTQPFIGGTAEAMRIRAATGLSPADIATSFFNGFKDTTLMGVAEFASWVTKKPVSMEGIVPPHMQKAYEWAHSRGMFDFSEAELAHEIGLSKGVTEAKKILNSSINIPEKMTRPPVFMWFSDMFVKAGYAEEEAFLRAQAATDFAMGNYHKDERPRIYSELGDAGKLVGALSTYKHNFLEQQVSSIVNWKREPAALITNLAFVFALYGIAGLPGYADMDTVVRWLTGLIGESKSIRELTLDDPKNPSKAMDGLVSWYSGYDIQSKVAMSQVFPDVSNPSSLAPHLRTFLDLASSSYDYAKNQDVASLNKLIETTLPTSMKNLYEAEVMTDSEGMVRDSKGLPKVEQPRTKEQTKVRKDWGIRPLQEKIDSETLWTQRQRETKRTDKLKDASGNFEKAVTLGDWEGANKAMDKYQELGGDIQVLTNKYEEILLRAQQTPKERAEGIPGSSLGSINRYQAYQ